MLDKGNTVVLGSAEEARLGDNDTSAAFVCDEADEATLLATEATADWMVEVTVWEEIAKGLSQFTEMPRMVVHLVVTIVEVGAESAKATRLLEVEITEGLTSEALDELAALICAGVDEVEDPIGCDGEDCGTVRGENEVKT